MKKAICPICQKPMTSEGPSEWPDWPFCSKRCRTIDLGRWLGGKYKVEAPLTAKDWEELESDDVKPADR